MQDKIVSYKTAKLAKEKGLPFYLDCSSSCNVYKGKKVSNYRVHTNYPDKEIYTFAPTQTLLQTWLRIKHNLVVYATRDMLGEVYDEKPFYFNNNKWIASIDDLNITTEGIAQMRGYPTNFKQYTTYEKALEAGLFEALKLI